MIEDSVIEEWLKLTKRQQTTFMLDEIYGKGLMKDFHDSMKRYVGLMDKIKLRYFYLITFTLKPGVPEDSYKLINKYIINRLQRSALSIEKADIVQEFTKKGVAHWHASVVSKKYISKDRFKYYENKYGFVDISKNHSQDYNTMYNYISKVNKPVKIVGF